MWVPLFFTDMTERIGVPTYTHNRTTTFGDYDNDGYPDIFFAGGWFERGMLMTLLHNEGNGWFTDRTAIIQGD
ncbi:MAG: hypothetical protein HY709_04405, partial [Candidatus Latescibacteria bacterium]|nr:hypothetical protein [Candidatus Latescibacterota bacterium]